MDVTTIIEKFRGLLEGDKYKGKINVPSTFLEINFPDILKHDFELANELLDNPEETITCAGLALKELSEETNKIKQILFYNLPESTKIPLSEISDQTERFLSFEGYITKPSDIYLKCKSAKFECPSCGNILNVLMTGHEWKEPSRCGCGRKGSFKELSKVLVRFQRIEILEAIDDVPDKAKRLVKKKVFIEENLTRKDLNEQLQSGQRVLITGFLELEEIKSTNYRKKSNEFKTNIVANNITPIDNSWGSIKLTAKIVKDIKKMAKKKKLLDEFAQSLAPSFEGYSLVRESLILQHVCSKRIFDSNGNLEERGVIHILMSGDPSKGKTYLMKRSLRISPLWNWATGKGLTKAGLIACVTRDEYGQHALEIGPYVAANNGILGLDEAEKMNKEDYGMLNNAMNDEQTKITKANIDQSLRTRTCLLATSNPLHKKFTDRESIISQLAPIPRDILDRFDLIWAMREGVDQDKLESKYMARHIIGSEVIKPIWSNEQMRHYIAYAKLISPIITKEVAKHFGEKFKKLTGKTISEEDGEEGSGQSHRLRGNIMRLAYAHSKFTSVGNENKAKEIEMSKDSIDYAFVLMRHSFNMLGVISDKGFVKYEEFEELPTKKEVNKYYLVRDTLKRLARDNKNLVQISFLLDEIKKESPEFDEDMLDKELEKLKKAGESFEPRRGYIGIL